ncbi:MAG TPA: hypothetical protein VFA54_16450 [Bryobacterales bacterium]|nr:hypothetical protein [Bryobacterales bacterium]
MKFSVAVLRRVGASAAYKPSPRAPRRWDVRPGLTVERGRNSVV